MSKICYVKKRFSGHNAWLIKNVNDIIELYRKKNTKPTIRKIFNKLVRDGDILEDNRSYKRLVSVISNARISGLIGWDDIDGRTQKHKGDVEL